MPVTPENAGAITEEKVAQKMLSGSKI